MICTPEPEILKVVQPGYTYIVDEQGPMLSSAIFSRIIESGRPGIYFTGEPPEHVMKEYSIPQGVEFVWITEVSVPGGLKPAMLDQINARRERFLDLHKNAVVLVDVLNVLLSANDFGNVFKLLSLIRDDTAQRKSITLISIDSHSIEPHQLRRVTRIARDVFSEENPPDAAMPELTLENGKTYFMKGGLGRIGRTLEKNVETGKPVLCIARNLPGILREKRNIPEKGEMMWLTKTSHALALRPDRPVDLFRKLEGFLEGGNSIAVLEGLDIIIAENGFNEVYKMIIHLMDIARLRNSILVIPIPRLALEDKQLSRLSQDAVVI